MVVKLHIASYDRLLKGDPSLPGRIANDLGCSISCIVMLRWRSGMGRHPTRSDGIDRVRSVNNWMREARRGEK